ncbi:MAG: AI-2E family transporter [Clostridia bacterium]|nr:AI-2E family transporter [Clostridia bacterium]
MKTEHKKYLSLGIGVFLLYLCIRYWDPLISVILSCLSAAVPLLVGCALAYVLNLLMTFYERHYFPKSTKNSVTKSRRPVCLLIAFLTLLVILAVVIGLIVPQLISCIGLLAEEIPEASQKTIAWLGEHHLLTDEVLKQLKDFDWTTLLNNVSGLLTSGIGSVFNIVVNTVSTLFSTIITIFVAVVFSIYLLSSKEKLAKQSDRLMRRYLKPCLIDKIEYVLDNLNTCFRRYIVGQCTEAVILGVLCLIGMLILQLPYATMISALIAFTALIPFAGAYIGSIVGAFMILTVSPGKALLFLIFIIVLQQLEGNLIYPRVVGSSLGLPPLWVLAAITVGGGMFGIIGMLLGVPLTATLYRIVRADIRKGKDTPSEAPKERAEI